MKKSKSIFILTVLFAIFVPVLFFSACGDKNGDGGKATYSIAFSEQTPTGVSRLNIANPVVEKSANVTFYIVIMPGYSKGTMKVLCNGTELTEFKTENTDGSTYLYYEIKNITEDKTITITGTLTHAAHNVKGIWVSNNATAKPDDKKLEDVHVDMEINSPTGDSETGTSMSFVANGFKDYITEKMLDEIEYIHNDYITFSVYAKDNYESFVDNFIVCNGERLQPYTKIINNEGTPYLKATYTIYITADTTVYFYESEIVRSVELATTRIQVEGVQYNTNFPQIVLRDENNVVIENYVDLKNANTINAYIENVTDVWKPILENPALTYSLSNLDLKFEIEDGNYIFKNVQYPYSVATIANYTLTITNAKDLIRNSNEYSKIELTKQNIQNSQPFSTEYITINDDGNYYYKFAKNTFKLIISKDYSRLQIELSNKFGDSENVTIVLSSGLINIVEGYTIKEDFSNPTQSDKVRQFLISFNGNGTFYNKIKLTALPAV